MIRSTNSMRTVTRGMLAKKRRHHRQHMQAAEDDRRCEREFAGRLCLLASETALGVVEFVEQFAASGGIEAARIGQRRAAAWSG